MNKLIKAFADQIFITGFVHCDPHPGNVFIRPHPKNPKDFQIVILDHGFCLEISNDFRKQYAEFWRAMFFRDVNQNIFRVKKWKKYVLIGVSLMLINSQECKLWDLTTLQKWLTKK